MRLPLSIAIAALLACGGAAAKPQAPGRAAPWSTPAERCILPAAQYHGINVHLLRAILKVESGLNAGAVNRNQNGTVDVGMGQINSIHFKQLARYGIAPSQLLDACVASYVSAWHLRQLMDRHGNSWETAARYHSGTPCFNRRYQILLTNELKRSGALPGQPQAVPPISSCQTASAQDRGAKRG